MKRGRLSRALLVLLAAGELALGDVGEELAPISSAAC
jgi:hypothetical protein